MAIELEEPFALSCPICAGVHTTLSPREGELFIVCDGCGYKHSVKCSMKELFQILMGKFPELSKNFSNKISNMIIEYLDDLFKKNSVIIDLVLNKKQMYVEKGLWEDISALDIINGFLSKVEGPLIDPKFENERFIGFKKRERN